MVFGVRKDTELKMCSFAIEPFDIALHATEEGVTALQGKIALWLRGLRTPARFYSWQIPADLTPKVDFIVQRAAHETNAHHQRLLTESRRFYQELAMRAQYQQSLFAAALWIDPEENEATVGRTLAGVLGAPVVPAPIHPLFEHRYRIAAPGQGARYWHLTPVGRPTNRFLWCFLVSYEFLPSNWTFFQPLPALLAQKFPLAMCIDVPKTYSRNDAISAVETTLSASRIHLKTQASSEVDSKSEKKVRDCYQALEELNDGDSLHEVQIILAVAGTNREQLSKNTQTILELARPYFLLRPEIGVGQVHAARFFSAVKLSRQIAVTQRLHPVVSRELAFFLSPVGQRKMGSLVGVLRGESATGSYPFFFDAWSGGKRATHEIVVGLTGQGKTFSVNLYLSRSYLEEGVPFDLLEPMGHGAVLAKALNLPHFSLRTEHIALNPLDVMFPTLVEQKTHVIRIYETILGRVFAGDQRGNLEKGFLGQAIEQVYADYSDKNRLNAATTPLTSEVCVMLMKLARSLNKAHVAQICEGLADEISGVCTGSGPYAQVINRHTNIDLSQRGKDVPRIFSFDGTADDETLLALAYTQVLAAIRRDSLIDDRPRIIVVDEVYRLLRHESLMDFMIEGTKTFRTRRKRLVLIDQQMSVFTTNSKARLIFENCPVRVIFNQRNGAQAFDDPAFNHMNRQHKEMVTRLGRGQCLLDITEGGIYLLNVIASPFEQQRFGST